MVYVYMFVYDFTRDDGETVSNGTGNQAITTAVPLTKSKQIRYFEALIADEHEHTSVIMINIVPLEVIDIPFEEYPKWLEQQNK
jgi:hypothetical protein